MPTVRVQAVFQGATLLPEDTFVNTFHFHDPTLLPYDAAAEACRANVAEFFRVVVTDTSVNSYMSSFIIPDFQVVSYNLLLPPGEREPTAETFTMGTPHLGTQMPEEVAICLTMHGAPPITPRRRGRVYIGPLSYHGDVGTFDEASTPTRVKLVTNSLGWVIASAAERLLDHSTTDGMPWCIRSVTPSENFVPIAGGWVDNAFDIQRRRGPDPTARLAWPL